MLLLLPVVTLSHGSGKQVNFGKTENWAIQTVANSVSISEWTF